MDFGTFLKLEAKWWKEAILCPRHLRYTIFHFEATLQMLLSFFLSWKWRINFKEFDKFSLSYKGIKWEAGIKAWFEWLSEPYSHYTAWEIE